MENDVLFLQKALCEKYKVNFCYTKSELKVGIALNVFEGIIPINGLRHPEMGDTTGWYIWAGEELSGESDFFQPFHTSHIEERCPVILKFLGLPPGWRFLLTGDYEDVWYDETLLDVSD